jgi:glutathione S-transferase
MFTDFLTSQIASLPEHLSPSRYPNLALPVLEIPEQDIRVDGVETVLRVLASLPGSSSASQLYGSLPKEVTGESAPDASDAALNAMKLCEWQAIIDSLLDWHARVLRPALTMAVSSRVWPELFGGSSVTSPLSPSAGVLSPQNSKSSDISISEKRARGVKELNACLEFLENTLKRANPDEGLNSNLCGPHPSIADLTISTALVAWDALPSAERPSLQKYPRLNKWLESWVSKPEWQVVHAQHTSFCNQRRAEIERDGR